MNCTTYEAPHDAVFSDALDPYFSLNMADHLAQPYKTTGEVIVLYISVLVF
jgi:hypothetical protein